MLSLGALTDLAGADIGVHIPRLPWPIGQPADQRRSFVPPEVTSQRSVVALLQNLPAQPAPVGHAQPVRLPLAPAIEQPTADDEGPPGRPCCLRRCDALLADLLPAGIAFIVFIVAGKLQTQQPR